MEQNRRSFLAITAASLLSAAPSKRPNILFALADDWSWPFSTSAGRKFPRTPNFDRVAGRGVMFTNSFVMSPSCTPSRGSILTGQAFWRLGEGANLFSRFLPNQPVYVDLLEQAGYHIGYTGKGWGPGDWRPSGRTRNPAGPVYNQRRMEPPAKGMSRLDYTANFQEFMAARKAGQPFCFWYGGTEPHRPYEKGSARRAGIMPEDVYVPPCLPDTEEVRGDIADYCYEVEWFDTHLGRMLEMLEKAGELDNTLVAVTGDNGLPFPRCKSNIYDTGTHVPLAVSWPARMKGGRTLEEFISLSDLAPTFLEAAGVAAPPVMTGRSFLDLLSGRPRFKRDFVLVGKERHVQSQPEGTGGYPMRGIRTRDFLYIRNYKPDRYPGGCDVINTSRTDTFVGPEMKTYRDVDDGPAKEYVVTHRDNPAVKRFFDLAFARRPAEELYDLRKDPGQITNVAGKADYSGIQSKLSGRLRTVLKESGDPRELGNGDLFDGYMPARDTGA